MRVHKLHNIEFVAAIISRLMMAAAVLLSAFLLFQVQPIIAKYILPWFGGAATVWTVCMLFFQLVLLIGYSYSHILVAYVRPREQALLHAVLLVVTLFILPISPDKSLVMEFENSPFLGVMSLLTLTIGVPYFALSTTSSLIQAWFSRVHVGRSPYPLYALSNFGSVIALLIYPFIIETNFKVQAQVSYWSVGYSIFVCLTLVISLYFAKFAWAQKSVPAEQHYKLQTTDDHSFLWFILACAASITLLATTDHLSRDVASIPFLWVIPLCLYLVSFILCFERDHWYQRRIFVPLLPLLIIVVGLDSIHLIRLSFSQQIILYCILLFVVCMTCHGELAKKRPPANTLTRFYLILSVGGAAGGFYVALLAPILFVTPIELFVGLGIVIGALAFVLYQDTQSRLYKGNTPWFWRSFALFAGIFVAFTYFYTGAKSYQIIEAKRNFYGTLQVKERDEPSGLRVKFLAHGTTLHGLQVISAPELAQEPTAYYARTSGLGQALTSIMDRPSRVGMIGLGIGTVAAYGKSGDRYRIYEINPEVTKLAKKHFAYLSASKADIDIIHGDGRLSLESEKPQRFDLLAVDAFSGDAIPVHLLTTQALALYTSHIKDDGILAIHTSNKYVDLRPVVLGTAKALGFDGIVVENSVNAEKAVLMSQWILLTKDATVYAKISAYHHVVESPVDMKEIIWTDDFSNLFSILKN